VATTWTRPRSSRREGGGAWRAAESAGNGKRGHLGEASQLNPGCQAVEVSQEDRVALGMSHDGHNACVEQLPQDRLGVLPNVKAGEFEKQVGTGIDGVGEGSVQELADVVAGDLEFAAMMNDRFSFAVSGEFLHAAVQQTGLEPVLRVGVGSGDDIGNSVFRGGAEHDETVLDRGGAVVEPPHDMAVDVDHCRGENSRRAPAPKDGWASGSWMSIHTGGAAQAAGTDWATSWKQRERKAAH